MFLIVLRDKHPPSGIGPKVVPVSPSDPEYLFVDQRGWEKAPSGVLTGDQSFTSIVSDRKG